jgi:hypothetical protein
VPPLPCSHIGRAEIAGDRDPEALRQPRSVANLDREPASGSMEYGLAVKPDDRDGGWVNAMLVEQALTLCACALVASRSASARPLGARPSVDQRGGVGKRLPQEGGSGPE